MSELNSIPKSYLLSPKTCQKKTLVLDLDETLVHSQFLPFPIKSDAILKINIQEQVQDIHVLIRPGVQTFLQRLSKLYEIVIFTASVSKYADPLLDILDKDNYCSFRLFREHCTMIGVTFIKDLNKLGRDLKDVIIVDNSPLSYSFNKENGIPILTWFSDKNDKELLNLIPILEFLSGVNDVREYIKDFVINDIISYENVIHIIDNYSKLNKDYECKKYIDEIIFNINNSNKNGNGEIKNDGISYMYNKNGKNNGYINITISNNEINNYLYFSPIYTINNNNDIKNSNTNNESFDKINIKINNEYEKTGNSKKNQKNLKEKKNILNSKTNRPKSKDMFNKINVKGKNKIKNKDIKIREMKFMKKNNIQKNIFTNNITNKSLNYVTHINSKDSQDYTIDSNIIDLKTIIPTKKSNSPKNFRLPKTPEIEEILYNTNKKSIKDIIINKIIYKTCRGDVNNRNKNQIRKNNFKNMNKLKHKIDFTINHKKHKSFNYTDINFDSNFLTLNNNNLSGNIFKKNNFNISPKNISLSKHKNLNANRTTKAVNNENMKMKFSTNNFHRKALSNQFKIVGITEFDKTNKIKKVTNFNLQINNSNSRRNNKIIKLNTINQTIDDNFTVNYSLKKFYNFNTNTSKRINQLNARKIIFNPIFTDKISKNETNNSIYNNTLRHKKTLSFNGNIYPLQIFNRTSSSAISKKMLREKSNNLNNANKNKNIIKTIKLNLNDLKKKKTTKIKEIKLVNVYENPKVKNNKTNINNNILLTKLFENANKLKKNIKINNIHKKSK
jgi:RNA polymerase II subunit A small phosphatase-like protein